MKLPFYKGFRGTKREKESIPLLKTYIMYGDIFKKGKYKHKGVGQRCAVGAKIEGILGV